MSFILNKFFTNAFHICVFAFVLNRLYLHVFVEWEFRVQDLKDEKLNMNTEEIVLIFYNVCSDFAEFNQGYMA
jgi:hypothetical protein